MQLAGHQIGPYSLLEPLGSGGMGEVWLAERSNAEFQQKVAIKLLHAFRGSEAGTRRFARERQILAGLNHSGIARLLDGGITNADRHYYVMEYVDGVSIDRYAHEHKLSVSERLNLFRKVCEAVQYAHQKLVIHSDLKPAHILVNKDGRVKLLDFGLARLSGQQGSSTLNTQIFSPAYASPEQVAGEPLTTSTDVYSLGVVLYELLTGEQPYDLTDKTALQALKEVSETIPPKPSSHTKKIAEDLNMICLKALEKQPEERYLSIEAFLEDLRRFSADLPVYAQARGYGYRIRKYMQRNFATTLLTSVALAVLVLTVLFYTLRLQQERAAAVEELQRAESLNRFFQELFETDNRRGNYAADFTAKELVDIGARRIETELGDQPEERLNLMLLIGRVYRLLGLLDEGRELQRKSLNLAMEYFEDGHPLIAKGQRSLSTAMKYSGNYRAADSLMTLAYTHFSDSSRPDYNRMDHRAVLNDYGITKRFLGKYDEAIDLYKLSMQMAGDDDEPRELLTSMNNLAEVYRRSDKLESAESLFVLIIPKLKENYGADHPFVAKSLNNLGMTYRRLGKVDESIAVLEESLSLREKLYSMEHPELCAALNNLGDSYAERNRMEDALAVYKRALGINKKFHGLNHSYTLFDLTDVTTTLTSLERYEEAEVAANELIEGTRKLHGEKHERMAIVYWRTGLLVQKMGRLDEMESYFRTSLNIMREAKPPLFHNTYRPLNSLAKHLLETGRYTEAEPLFLEALEITKKNEKRMKVEKQNVLQRLIKLYEALGKPEDAGRYAAMLVESGER